MTGQRSAREQAIYDRLFYPGTEVFRNKLDIRDAKALAQTEGQFTFARARSRPSFQKFDLPELQKIHQHLLGDLYEWAGKIRTYTTGRNAASFARPEHLESYFENTVRAPLERESFLRETNVDEFAKRSAHYVNELNAVHPFIEGNGRITRLYLQDLGKQAGHEVSISRIGATKGAWYAAMAHGFNSGDTSLIEKEIRAATMPSRGL